MHDARVLPEGKPDELTWHANAVPRGIVAIADFMVLIGLGFAIWAAGGGGDTEPGYPTVGSTKTVDITMPDGTVKKIAYIPEQHAADVYQAQTQNAYERISENVPNYAAQEAAVSQVEQQNLMTSEGAGAYKTSITGGGEPRGGPSYGGGTSSSGGGGASSSGGATGGATATGSGSYSAIPTVYVGGGGRASVM